MQTYDSAAFSRHYVPQVTWLLCPNSTHGPDVELMALSANSAWSYTRRLVDTQLAKLRSETLSPRYEIHGLAAARDAALQQSIRAAGFVQTFARDCAFILLESGLLADEGWENHVKLNSINQCCPVYLLLRELVTRGFGGHIENHNNKIATLAGRLTRKLKSPEQVKGVFRECTETRKWLASTLAKIMLHILVYQDCFRRCQKADLDLQDTFWKIFTEVSALVTGHQDPSFYESLGQVIVDGIVVGTIRSLERARNLVDSCFKQCSTFDQAVQEFHASKLADDVYLHPVFENRTIQHWDNQEFLKLKNTTVPIAKFLQTSAIDCWFRVNTIEVTSSHIENSVFDQARFSGNINNSLFKNCEFNRCVFSSAVLSNSQFIDCTFKECQLTFNTKSSPAAIVSGKVIDCIGLSAERLDPATTTYLRVLGVRVSSGSSW